MSVCELKDLIWYLLLWQCLLKLMVGTVLRGEILLKNERPTWCHLLFYFTSYVLNMFRILIYPSSGACDCVVELPHRSSCTMVFQQHSRKLLMMDILMSETCWAHKKWNKIESDIKLVFHSSAITMMHGPINISDILCLQVAFFIPTERFVGSVNLAGAPDLSN